MPSTFQDWFFRFGFCPCSSQAASAGKSCNQVLALLRWISSAGRRAGTSRSMCVHRTRAVDIAHLSRQPCAASWQIRSWADSEFCPIARLLSAVDWHLPVHRSSLYERCFQSRVPSSPLCETLLRQVSLASLGWSFPLSRNSSVRNISLL